MNTHKATSDAWRKVRNWAENESYADSVLLEVADRLTALEKDSLELARTAASAGINHERRLTALEAAATPPPAPDHFPDATEMVATDEELIETFYVGARGASATPGFRAIYNLGRQHSAQSRQEEEVAPPPAPAGGLVDCIMETVMLDPGWLTGSLTGRAVRAIHAVADWLQQRSDIIANGSQWAEMLRREAEL
jgi:hypothetical protein